MKKKPLIIVGEIILVAGLTFLSWPISSIGITWVRLALVALLNLVIGISGFAAAGISNIDVDFEWRSWKQYLIGIGICLLLSLAIAWLPAMFGCSLVGTHEDLVGWKFAYNLFNYILIIGPAEEMVFRIYFEKSLIALFDGRRWAGIIASSALFGFWHLINGSWVQVAFTFAIGCVFGFAKEYIKDFHYPGIALCHGLYDFLNYIVRLTIL